MRTQDLIMTAVNMATRAVLAGDPIVDLIWIPPQTGSDSPEGLWAIETMGNRSLSGGDKAPWDL